jgi:hypothetical protein
MAEPRPPRWRLYGTALALLAEGAHLAWEHLHGGILRHHILNRADLPAISNAWGLLLLPALTWFLLGRIQARSLGLTGGRRDRFPNVVVAGFTGALLFGIALSTCFIHNLPTLTEYLFDVLLLLALLLPVYRAECVLGFVLGMAFVFGVVLPTAVATVIAAFSALIHRAIRPLLLRLWHTLNREGPPTARLG